MSQAMKSALTLNAWATLAAVSGSPSAGSVCVGTAPGVGGADGAWVAVGSPARVVLMMVSPYGAMNLTDPPHVSPACPHTVPNGQPQTAPDTTTFAPM